MRPARARQLVLQAIYKLLLSVPWRRGWTFTMAGSLHDQVFPCLCLDTMAAHSGVSVMASLTASAIHVQLAVPVTFWCIIHLFEILDPFPHHVLPAYSDINLDADFMARCAILMAITLLGSFLHIMIFSAQFCMPICRINNWWAASTLCVLLLH